MEYDSGSSYERYLTMKNAQPKLPGVDGVEVRHTLCDICTPGVHCGVDVYVKNGELLKLEGTPGFPPNRGALCPKGASGRQYVLRPDRIQTPMRRVGARGSGEFEPIGWDEALALAAAGLNAAKARSGAESTVFLSGYGKWYRPFLQRLAYDFGSPNFLTESSSCWWSAIMASRCVFGHATMPDLQNAAALFIWGSDPFNKNIHQTPALFALKARGGKIVVVDPRRGPASEQLADLYLRPRLGTDAALAAAMANHIIESGLADFDFIEKYVHGFAPYREYVSRFSLAEGERITGVPAALIREAAELFARTKPDAIMTGTGLTHRKNGFNASRALMSLAAVCGQFDRPGTLRPTLGAATFCNTPGGFTSREAEFTADVQPKTAKPAVGLPDYPLFAEMMHEGQAISLAEQIESGAPYPIRAALLAGVNHKMYPDSPRFLRALRSLDFIVATDLFWTESCRSADIVLPACSSFERAEVKCYANRFMYYTQPVIPPLYESRPDAEIFAGLARALGLDDPLLCAGYDTCVRWMLFEPSGLADWEAFRRADRPVPAPNARGYEWGAALARGVATPTGKIELFSETIAAYRRPELDPLPVYADSFDAADAAEFDLTLCAGARNPGMLHSRLHACPWPRSLRPEASVDINPADADARGIAQGDMVELATPLRAISVRANLTLSAAPGEVYMYHGYDEADVNSLIPADHRDPYTGFPGYKQLRCRVTKKEG